jgi:hypothetical protein
LIQAFWIFIHWGFVYGSYKTAKVNLEDSRKKSKKYLTDKQRKTAYLLCFIIPALVSGSLLLLGSTLGELKRGDYKFAITAFFVLSLPALYSTIMFLGEEKDKKRIEELLD